MGCGGRHPTVRLRECRVVRHIGAVVISVARGPYTIVQSIWLLWWRNAGGSQSRMSWRTDWIVGIVLSGRVSMVDGRGWRWRMIGGIGEGGME